MDYFDNKSQKSQSAGGSAQDPHLVSITTEIYKTLLPLNISG